MIHGFDDPELLFFDWTKGHLSSKSISGIAPAIMGSSVVAALARSQ
jgi:hypothetical protein